MASILLSTAQFFYNKKKLNPAPNLRKKQAITWVAEFVWSLIIVEQINIDLRGKPEWSMRSITEHNELPNTIAAIK